MDGSDSTTAENSVTGIDGNGRVYGFGTSNGVLVPFVTFQVC